MSVQQHENHVHVSKTDLDKPSWPTTWLTPPTDPYPPGPWPYADRPTWLTDGQRVPTPLVTGPTLTGPPGWPTANGSLPPWSLTLKTDRPVWPNGRQWALPPWSWSFGWPISIEKLLDKILDKIRDKHAVQDHIRNNPLTTWPQNSVDLNRQVNASIYIYLSYIYIYDVIY